MTGHRFGQEDEPHGRYLQHIPDDGNPPPTGWERGTVAFHSPLVVHHDEQDIYGPNGWKARLSRHFGGLTGKRLSKAIAKAGHDAVVTVWPKTGETSEIVDLTMFHRPKPT